MSVESQKIDILLSMKKKGYNLKDTEDPAELPHDVPEAVVSQEVEDAQKASEEAEKLAKLEAIMDGEAEPETKPVTRVQKTVRHEKPVQRMPAVIPISMRDIQIKELSIDDIKQYICPAATDQEAFMFLKLCQARQLNPFLNEAYLIKYGDKATMTVGKEAFMRRAEAHPQFDGYEAGIIIQNADKTLERREGTFILKNEVLVGGWATKSQKEAIKLCIKLVADGEIQRATGEC